MATTHQLFKNNSRSTLNGTLSIGATTMNVAAGHGNRFPTPSAGQYLYITLYEKDGAGNEINYEIAKVTSITGDTMTLVRDIEGLVVAAGGTSGGWSYPASVGVNPSQIVYVEMRYTAFAANNNLTKDGNLEGLESAASARTNLGLGSMATQNANSVSITGGSITGVTLQDSDVFLVDNTDPSKKVQFELASIATGTTRTITVPNNSITLAGTNVDNNFAATQTFQNDIILTGAGKGITFEGVTADAFEATLTGGEPTADRTLTLPDASDELVGKAATQTLTNKTLTSPVITSPSLTRSSAVAVTAGSDAQGQGALTSDVNVITTAGSNPSAVTLPTASAGREVVIINRGANPLNIYPATGGSIDALAANTAIPLAVGGNMRFMASSSTQWASSNAMTFSSYQPLDSELSAIAGLVSAADSLPYFTGSGSAALTTLTAAGRALIDDADAATQRTTLGLGNVTNESKSTMFSSPTFTGTATTPNLAFNTSGGRITGDFSNSTVANRVMFQTSTVNSGSFVSTIPNGTALASGFVANGAADPTNTNYARMMTIAGTDIRFESGINGTGTYLPMTFYTGGSERLRITTTGNTIALGNLSVGSSNEFSNVKAHINQGADFTLGTNYALYIAGSGYAGGIALDATSMQIGQNSASRALTFHSGTGFAERMRIDSSGNVGIGTAPSGANLHVKAPTNTVIQSEGGAGYGAYYAKGSGTNASYVFFGNVTNGEKARLTNDGVNDALYIATGNAATQRLYVGNAGTLHIDPTSGLGYGTGAGGTVTQATSRITPVTLNKPTGAITLFTAAGTSSWTVFQVINSLVAATDTVVVSVKSGTNIYVANVAQVAAGSFTIAFSAISGTASDAPVINFAIIKGATA